jgi:hypothetical protein
MLELVQRTAQQLSASAAKRTVSLITLSAKS